MTEFVTMSPKGQALFELMLHSLMAGFRLRAVGRELGAVSASGGVWGVLRELSVDGPQTVPDMARKRPVARQYMQKVVNDLMDDGLVELIPNPRHKRSKLVTLTDDGKRTYGDLDKRLRRWTESLARLIDEEEADIETAKRVLTKLNVQLGGELGLEDEAALHVKKVF